MLPVTERVRVPCAARPRSWLRPLAARCGHGCAPAPAPAPAPPAAAAAPPRAEDTPSPARTRPEALPGTSPGPPSPSPSLLPPGQRPDSGGHRLQTWPGVTVSRFPPPPLPPRCLLPPRSLSPAPSPPAVCFQVSPARLGSSDSLPIHPASGEAAEEEAEEAPAGRRSALSAAVSAGPLPARGDALPAPGGLRSQTTAGLGPSAHPPRVSHHFTRSATRSQHLCPGPSPPGSPLCRSSPERLHSASPPSAPPQHKRTPGHGEGGPGAHAGPWPPRRCPRRPPPPAPGCASPRATSQALRSWE